VDKQSSKRSAVQEKCESRFALGKTITIMEQSVMTNIKIAARSWKENYLPRRILVIRLQAMGDVVATLPYLQQLRNSLPAQTRIDFLTRQEVEEIPKSIVLFDNIFVIKGGRDLKKQILSASSMLPKLFRQRYEVIMDLQNNNVSRIVRKALFPKAWSAFDRFSPIPGGERYRMAIEGVGLGKNWAVNKFSLTNPKIGKGILTANGWLGEDLVVLNPAGAFPTRNWALNNYVAFAKSWLSLFPHTKFLVLGTSFIGEKGIFLKKELGDRLIDLVGKTSPAEAFAVLQEVRLVLSEDSGLMHMAWVSGIPTFGLFGSTRTDWVRPLGGHTFFLDSSDLQCGHCMQETCRFHDVHCLTRYTPQFVLDKTLALLERVERRSKINM
jgi:ADP-heptose:LPS heptosyltransferase